MYSSSLACDSESCGSAEPRGKENELDRVIQFDSNSEVGSLVQFDTMLWIVFTVTSSIIWLNYLCEAAGFVLWKYSDRGETTTARLEVLFYRKERLCPNKFVST